jgi:hypothetical protein
MPRRRLALLAGVFVAAACTAHDSTSPGSPLNSSVAKLVIVSGNGASFVVGTNFGDTLLVRAVDSSGNAVPNAVVAWYARPDCCSSALNTSGIPLLAGVPQNTSCPQSLRSVVADSVCSTADASGTARAVWYFGGSFVGSPPVFAGQTRAGPLQAQVTASGNPVDTFTVTALAGPPATLTLNPVGNNGVLCIGNTWQSTVGAVTDQYGNAVVGQAATVSWSSSNAGIATVSTTGLITAVAAGTDTVTAVAGGATTFEVAFVTPVCGGSRD